MALQSLTDLIERNAAIPDVLQQLIFRSLPTIEKQFEFAGRMEPYRQQALLDAWQALSPANRLAAVERVKRGLMSRAATGATRMSPMWRNAGLSSSSRNALATGALNQAQREGHKLVLDALSPEKAAEAALQRLSLLTQSQMPSLLNSLLSMSGTVMGAPQPAKEPSFMDTLLGIAKVIPAFL